MKRLTKKEREKEKAEEAAALEQFNKWISARSQVSLIYPGPFFGVSVEGNLVRVPGDPNKLDFLGLSTPIRVSISLSHCRCYGFEGSRKNVVVWLQGPTELALVLLDRDDHLPDVAELLKLSGGRPN